MKKLLFSALFMGLMFLQNAKGQEYFEGYIHYTYEYFTLEGENITKQKQDVLFKEQHYYIKEGNYVAFDQEEALIQLYNQKGNVYYYKNGDGVYKLDAGIWEQGKSNYSKGKKKAKILKYRCESVKKDKSVTFYSNKIKVNPANFESHKFGDWSGYLEFTNGALALRIVTYYDDYYQVMTANKIVPMKLDDSKFDIKKILNVK
ncbi:hypothetical protein MM213_06485 [Belliella sp. R4-6]|uniref:MORN repeat variant n=1 Tax=Belliella alkalica TaxID=1730871 RepID=A0ABS9V9L7_9BACT|nr:hypothetical protein [Belliella alkalica]MCH7413122.1 hypothetical protein [Belliella alkalica]